MATRSLILPLNGVIKYTVDPIAYGPIDTDLLKFKFKDGRITGLLLEDLYDGLFRNVTKCSDKASEFDLFVTDKHNSYHYQSKVISSGSNSFDLCPSFMKGKGRKYDEDKMHGIIRRLDGYVLTDISNFPDLVIYTLPARSLYSYVKERSAKIKLNQLQPLCREPMTLAPKVLGSTGDVVRTDRPR